MNDPHLDDEQLSLLLDGGDVDGRGHAQDGACDRCAARLAALRAARDAVAGAVVAPLPPEVLERVVATALEGPLVAEVVPMRSTSRRRRVPVPPQAWLVGAAAGIALLVGVAGLLRAADVSRSGNDAGLAITADEESSGRDADSATKSAPAAGLATGASVSPDPELVVVDLADQDDPTALTRALEGITLQVTATARARSSSDLSAEGSTPADDAFGGQATSGAASPTSTVLADRAQCRSRADAIGAGRFGELLSTATLRWKGRPAEVLVFRLAEPSSPDAPETRQALVLSRPGCELLADPRF